MARTNKYTSINFNHVLDKNIPVSGTAASTAGTTRKQASSSYSSIASPNSHLHGARTHGRMLVLTKPTPKPFSVTPPLSSSPASPSSSSSTAQTQQPQTQIPDRNRSEPGSDQISLRPLGQTRSCPGTFSPVVEQESEKEVGSVVVRSPKPGKFLPPHLRPGFVAKEERPAPDVLRTRESVQKHFGSSSRYGDDGRPKSGGYERSQRGGESDPRLMSRPRSSGNRANSSRS